MTSRPPIGAMMNEMRTAHGSACGSGMAFAAAPIPPKNSESAKTYNLAFSCPVVSCSSSE